MFTKKKLVFLTSVTLALAILATSIAYATQPVEIIVNGKKLNPDTPAQIIEGRAMVPIRFVAEALGAAVTWDSVNNQVIINSPAGDNNQPSYNLLKLNGEPTTWPYWYEDGVLYMEYRNTLELLRTKFQGPWYSVNFYPSSSSISISGKKEPVKTKKINEYTVISLQSLERTGFIKFSWDPDTENITLID